jgi:hypothetical protein
MNENSQKFKEKVNYENQDPDLGPDSVLISDARIRIRNIPLNSSSRLPS